MGTTKLNFNAKRKVIFMTTTFNLTKGDKFNLTKAVPSLNRIRVDLSWQTPVGTRPPYDLDVSAFGLRTNSEGKPKLYGDEWFIFFNQEAPSHGAIWKSPDERSGGVETLMVEISKVPGDLTEISVIVTIYEGDKNGQTFGQVSDSVLRIYNDETNDLVCEYKLAEKFTNETSVQVGSLFNDNGVWTFEALGAGYVLGLGDYLNAYQ